MDLQEAIEERRSIRKYKDIDVDDSVIMELLESARLAPSAKNLQPWRFMVLRGDRKDKIAELMKEYHYKNPEKTAGMLSTGIYIEQAPVLVMVFRESDGFSLERNDVLSLGAGIEHILLKATDLGLGSLWICDMYKVREEICKYLGVDLELYSCIALGYADENPDTRPRKSLEELIIK